MKYLNGVLMLVMVIVFTACGSGGNNSKSILTSTSWSLDIDAALKEIPQEQLKKMPEAILKTLKEGLKKTRFDFKKDGKITMVGGPTGKEQSGSWTLSEDGKTVTITQDETGKATPAKILEISPSKLVLEMESGGRKSKAVLIPSK